MQVYQAYSKQQQQPQFMYVPWQSTTNMGFADQTYGSYGNSVYGGGVAPMYRPPMQQPRRCNPWIAAMVVIVVVIGLGLAVGLPLGLIRPWEDSTTATPTRDKTLTGELRITTLQYSAILSDPSSPTFKEYSDFICKKVVAHVDRAAASCEVISFRAGSLVAQYALTIAVPDSMNRLQEEQLIKDIATDIHEGVLADSVLGVDENGVIFEDGNACASGPCVGEGRECVRLPFAYECQCADGLREEEGECVAETSATTSAYHDTTGADAMTTGADAMTTGANDMTTGADAMTTGADAMTTGADAMTTRADGMTTGADAMTTGADAMTTGADAMTTGADAMTTGADAMTTGADAMTTGADAMTTGADAMTTGADAMTTGADAMTTISDAMPAGGDE